MDILDIDFEYHPAVAGVQDLFMKSKVSIHEVSILQLRYIASVVTLLAWSSMTEYVCKHV